MGRLKRRLCLREHGVDVEDVLNNWGPDDLKSHIKAKVTREVDSATCCCRCHNRAIEVSTK